MGLTYQGDSGTWTADEIRRARETEELAEFVKEMKQKQQDCNGSNQTVTDGPD